MASAAVLNPTDVLASPAPPAVTGPKTRIATRPSKSLPEWLTEEASKVERVPFDPAKHLAFKRPERIRTMKELGLEGCGISDTAASDPFSLFTPEAIWQFRAELFSDVVVATCQYTSDFASNMIRGFGPALCPFIFEAWNHPETLKAISSVAGIDLVPAIEYDVGHINIALNFATNEITAQAMPSSDEDMTAFAWHHDSFPFVCVTMISDCTGMVGGETVLRAPDGTLMKVRGPSMGTAVVMQGRYIEHQALKARGTRERIAMITSLRPKNPLIRDESILTGVRPISDVSKLYKQYSQYRLEMLEERTRDQLKRMREREHAQRPFDIEGAREWMKEQIEMLQATMGELI